MQKERKSDKNGEQEREPFITIDDLVIKAEAGMETCPT